MSLMHHIRSSRLAALSALWLAIFFLTRCLLLITHLREVDAGLWELLRIFGTGLIYDLSFLVYAVLPPLIVSVLLPGFIRTSPWYRRTTWALTVTVVFLMLFTATAEWLFWQEFDTRFNFIAVDYLIYSHEVVNNILESYPIYPIIALLLLLATAITTGMHHFQIHTPDSRNLSAWKRLTVPAWLTVSALLITVWVGQDFPRQPGGNAPQRELAGNGPFQLFAAFRNNELDYEDFYATLSEVKAGDILRQEVREPNAEFLDQDPLSVRRAIDNPGSPRNLNIVLVTVESLSAKYLGSFGDTHGLTPNLDRLRHESLFFTDFYATGTRTTRGLEAITLSVPPTPGRSIVKRLGRETGYASIGRQLGVKGYDCVFLYGGRGYFDNMNAFFSGNGYRIVDQSSVAETDISFKNAWGMCDEDLYEQALLQADADHAAGRPFFLHLMTTSNHRPFTYPENRVDIPSGHGRKGAVKYTDYAIGRFLDRAREKPWFARTIFVIVADHAAHSAGREDLPVTRYHIPLFLYAPGLIAPRDVPVLSSQIDLAPTLLGLLNFDYESTFFGRNVLEKDAAPGRALIATYRHLGLFDGRNLAILSPKKIIRRHNDATGLSLESTSCITDPLVRRDIAYYQGASYEFQNDLLRWSSEESE